MLLSISSTLRQVRGLATMSRLRVVTYNLLTPNYATPKDYPVSEVDLIGFMDVDGWIDAPSLPSID